MYESLLSVCELRARISTRCFSRHWVIQADPKSVDKITWPDMDRSKYGNGFQNGFGSTCIPEEQEEDLESNGSWTLGAHHGANGASGMTNGSANGSSNGWNTPNSIDEQSDEDDEESFNALYRLVQEESPPPPPPMRKISAASAAAR